MKNIDLYRRAIEHIKSVYGLPKQGFIAGGSLANLVWEYRSGNKAVINDVDIFIFEKEIEFSEEMRTERRYNYMNGDVKYFEDYSGMNFTSITKEYYSINRSERDDIFNYIYYDANTGNPGLIINSFDLNCVQIGYSIEEDKFYHTRNFEEFIETGELKIVNLMTPSHTAIRIFKKKRELNALLNDFEIDLIKYSMYRSFKDVNKYRFKEKYLNMFQEYREDLHMFDLSRDLRTEEYLKSAKGIITELYFMTPKNKNDKKIDHIFDFESGPELDIFKDGNLQKVFRTVDFIFYMRHIYGDDNRAKVWNKLCYYFDSEDYLDIDVDEKDIELFVRLSHYAPNVIDNLRGLKLSEQLCVVNKVFDKFKENPLVAISILEKNRISPSMEIDDQTALILELSVRIQILNDPREKVRKILDINQPIVDRSEKDEFDF